MLKNTFHEHRKHHLSRYICIFKTLQLRDILDLLAKIFNMNKLQTYISMKGAEFDMLLSPVCPDNFLDDYSIERPW